MTIHLHRDDLPGDIAFGAQIAVDTETLGLNLERDRLCLVQLSAGDGAAHLVQIRDRETPAPNLARLLADRSVLKLFHFGRFDLAVLARRLGVMPEPVYCTKIASRLTRTFADRHGLKDLCRDVLGVEISKQQQLTDWGAPELTPEQMAYAASDVLYLHALKERFDALLAREGRTALAEAAFAFLPHRARLDLAGWNDIDIFAH
jgi:ribonuclease D